MIFWVGIEKDITKDLYKENIDFLKPEDLSSLFGSKNEENRKHPILKYAYQFLEADKYIVAAPMWNLNIPAILKAYIDYISVTWITFKYTANGPVGLCGGKKAVYILSRGGSYSQGLGAEIEMGDKYLRTIFGFFGINDFTTIASENLDVIGEDVESIIEDTINNSQKIAREF